MADLFDMYQETCFSDYWKAISIVDLHQLADLLRNVIFSDFQYGSSHSTVDLLTVESNRIATAFNTSDLTPTIILDKQVQCSNAPPVLSLISQTSQK